jgi:hypothetical protein
MSSEVETSLDASDQKIIRDSSTPLGMTKLKSAASALETYRSTTTSGGFDTAKLTGPCRFESGELVVIVPGHSDVTSVNLPLPSGTVRTVNGPSPVIIPPRIPRPSTRA